MVFHTQAEFADVRCVGIPRALLYYRYGPMWKAFFEALGREVIISPETDKALVDRGTALSVDECCLASKTYMGHVDWLLDRCDAIFVPCYASGDARQGFCTKFQSLPDLVRSTFREALQENHTVVLSCEFAHLGDAKERQKALSGLALSLGASPKEADRVYKIAIRAQQEAEKEATAHLEQTLKLHNNLVKLVAKDKSGQSEQPLSILLVAHPYITHDRYICGDVIDALLSMGVTILYADEINHKQAYKQSFDFSSTLPWVINRELIGAILQLKEKVNGIVLVSAFPCGPDSMTDDAIMRVIQGIPILNLMIDAQSGTAGIQTRVESFVDILKFQQKGGYVHG